MVLGKKAIKQFLKPDFRKVILLLLILIPFVSGFTGLVSLPPQFDFLNNYIFTKSNRINLIQYPMYLILFRGFGYMPDSQISEEVVISAFIISALIGLFFWYVLICIVVSLWKEFFRIFGSKARLFEGMTVIIVVSLFVFQAILLPSEIYNSISINVNTRHDININEAFEDSTKLQELTIRNSSDSATNYKLPGVTACLYNTENKSLGYYFLEYVDDKAIVVGEAGCCRGAIIPLSPNSETKIYTQGTINSKSYGASVEAYKAEFDEILMLKNSEHDGYNYACSDLTEEQISRAEKIKITR